MESEAWWRWVGWVLGGRKAMTRGTTRVEPGPIVHRLLGIIMKLARVRNLVFNGSHFLCKAWNFLARVPWQSMCGIARRHPHVPSRTSLRWWLRQWWSTTRSTTRSTTALPRGAIGGFRRAVALLWCAHPLKRTGIPS